MYGPGTAPPRPPGKALVIGLRVLFTVLPFVTLGVAAWGSVLRLALMRRRALDWALLPVVTVLGVGGFILVGSSGDDTPQSNVGAVGIFVCMLGVPVYFLVADILWSSYAADRAAGSALYGGPLPPQPYAAGTLHGAARGPIPGAPATPPATGMAGTPGRPQYGYPPQTPQTPQIGSPPHPSGTPAPPRINQVRAELDELSDFLRKEEGR